MYNASDGSPWANKVLPPRTENQVAASAIDWMQSSSTPGKAPDFRMRDVI
jgi:hypothetical protein